jgi:hypothetical protein
LAAIAQADGKHKNRPVLLLREMPKYGDFLVCGISTQLQQFIPDFDEIIRSIDHGILIDSRTHGKVLNGHDGDYGPLYNQSQLGRVWGHV